jgi:hypothetical protein
MSPAATPAAMASLRASDHSAASAAEAHKSSILFPDRINIVSRFCSLSAAPLLTELNDRRRNDDPLLVLSDVMSETCFCSGKRTSWRSAKAITDDTFLLLSE